MSRTKKQKIEEPAKIEVSSGFRLKITNLRKDAFPDPLTESDYMGAKVGDFMIKNTSTIYEVVGLSREPFPDTEYDRILKNLTAYNQQIRDQKLKDLIDKYKKSNNFGACIITLKSVIRGGKIVAKGKITRLNEITASGGYYSPWRIVTLPDIAKTKKQNAKYFEDQIAKLESKRQVQLDIAKTIDTFIQSRILPEKVDVHVVGVGTIEELVVSKLL